MITNNKTKETGRSAEFIKSDSLSKVKEISDESLNGVIEIIKAQQKQYRSVGLTQVSHWL
jgi:hypothetical protein